MTLVSTSAIGSFQLTAARRRLPSGWSGRRRRLRFQLTAARRRLRDRFHGGGLVVEFQLTAARRRLQPFSSQLAILRCFNSQPPEGGCQPDRTLGGHCQRFNSQPPEGGCHCTRLDSSIVRCFNSQPPEGGCVMSTLNLGIFGEFQLTAARRRLQACKMYVRLAFEVSTHSRPKAAASAAAQFKQLYAGFNSQPPEGGCAPSISSILYQPSFQLTAARRRLHEP